MLFQPGHVQRLGRCCHGLYSIRVRLVVLIAAAMTLVYGGVAYNQIQETSARLNEELNQQNLLLASVYAKAMADDVWNLNKTALERQLNVLVTHQDIVSVEIRELNDLFTLAVSSGRSAGYQSGAADEKLVITRPVQYEDGDVIGQLTISVSRDRIEAEKAFLFHDQLLRFLIVAVVVLLVVIMTVANLIRPIMMITQAMTKLADGDLRIPIPAVNRKDEIGDMARSLAVFKANAEQLQGALDRERELNGLQRQFVSMVSHEFRTPLAIIDGNAQRLERRLETISKERIVGALRTIRRSVGRLTGLMESVLDAAHLEEGRIKFEPGDAAITPLLEDMIDRHRELHPDRDFVIRLENLPSTMRIDERLIRQVVSNLMSNALKYSPTARRFGYLRGVTKEKRSALPSATAGSAFRKRNWTSFSSAFSERAHQPGLPEVASACISYATSWIFMADLSK